MITTIFKKRKIEKKVVSYCDIFFESLKQNKETLMQAFIIYYGEKYKSHVEAVFKNMHFYMFFSAATTEVLNSYLSPIEEISDTFTEDLIYVKDYGKSINIYFDEDDDILPCCLKEDYKFLKKHNELVAFCSGAYDIDTTEETYIYLSVFESDLTLIHEINHAINGYVLGKIKIKKKSTLLEKRGVWISNSDTSVILEEILNDYTSYKIDSILKNDLHTTINKYSLIVSSTYSILFPLIEEFYETFKDVIIESRITCNKNVLFKRIDKNKYEEFESLIIEAYNDCLKDENNLSKYIEPVNKLVKSMEISPKKENIEEYIYYLQKLGKTIKLLNKDDNTKQNCKIKKLIK